MPALGRTQLLNQMIFSWTPGAQANEIMKSKLHQGKRQGPVTRALVGKVWGDQSSGGRTGAVPSSVCSSTCGCQCLRGISVVGAVDRRAGRGFVEDPHHRSHCYHLLSSYYARDIGKSTLNIVEVGIDVLI